MNIQELTGRTRTHLTSLSDPGCLLHHRVVQPFLNLRRAALRAGIDLVPESSFRAFERQLSIWNGKYSGERPMYDPMHQIINVAELAPNERINAILQWSALPGASRHHWGTDLDLVDRYSIRSGYTVQLTPEEFVSPGPFAALSDWLTEHASHYGFFRPFRGVRSGVQAEPWHFSFAPIAELARRSLKVDALRQTLVDAPLLGKECVLSQLDELHARYVARIDWP